MEIVGPSQKDPDTSRLYVLAKIDSLDSVILRDAMKDYFQNYGDKDNLPKMKSIENMKDLAKEIWKQTNPS